MTDQTKHLLDIVPAVYRNRDTGDLQKYFAGTGGLLDKIQKTLEQKYADNFPDSPIDGSLACQPWLLPYFADLLDVTLVSPLIKGQRAEIAHAVRWRQSKGTVRTIADIAEAVGQLSVVVQEAWLRMAMTPRLNQPIIPATAWGYVEDAPATPPSIAARHPALPALTPDLRCPAGAVAVSSANAAARQTTVDGQTFVWRQTSYHGAPCQPGHYNEMSRRTVDFRCPDWRRGHYHPQNLLLFTVPPAGFFPAGVPTVNWSDELSEAFFEWIDVRHEGNKTIYRNKSLDSDHFQPVRIRRTIKLGQVPSGVGDADFHTWRFEGLILENTLEADSGRIELDKCAARWLKVHAIDEVQPVLSASNCLIRRIQAARALVQLEYCTVLDLALCEVINASDCIFQGIIKKDHATDTPPERGCLRYSAIVTHQQSGGMSFARVIKAKPEFFANKFGERSCGVLHPSTSKAIRQGSADGSEMGAYHFQCLSLLPDAVVQKLASYLPLGMQAVVVPDAALVAGVK